MLLFGEVPFLGKKGKSLIDRFYGIGELEIMKPVITVEIDHQLKILPQYFQAVAIGDKSFEIRKNDRDYKVGDNIVLKEYEKGHFTGRNILVTITYITDYEQKDDYVVFGIKKYFDLDLISNPPMTDFMESRIENEKSA